MTTENDIVECPNCTTLYSSDFNYCPKCGQSKEHTILSFKEITTDLLGALVAFDSKFFHSLPKMFFRPGLITKEYLAGKRASHLSPFRLYLFLSIVFFLLLSLLFKDNSMNLNPSKQTQSILDSLDTELQLANEDSSDIQLDAEEEDSSFNIVNFDSKDTAILIVWKQSKKMQNAGYTMEEISDSLWTDLNVIRKFVLKQVFKIQSTKGQGLLSVFIKSTSYALFIFLPLFALIFKLLYIRKKKFYFEHLIFSLHYFSFLFFTLIIYLVFKLVNVGIPLWIFSIIFVIYLYIAMLKVYEQTWKRTLLKSIALLFTSIVFLTPIMLIIAVLISFIFY